MGQGYDDCSCKKPRYNKQMEESKEEKRKTRMKVRSTQMEEPKEMKRKIDIYPLERSLFGFGN